MCLSFHWSFLRRWLQLGAKVFGKNVIPFTIHSIQKEVKYVIQRIERINYKIFIKGFSGFNAHYLEYQFSDTQFFCDDNLLTWTGSSFFMRSFEWHFGIHFYIIAYIIESCKRLNKLLFVKITLKDKSKIRFTYKKVSKVGDYCRGWPEGSLFNSTFSYTEVLGKALLLYLDCSTFSLIHTL